MWIAEGLVKSKRQPNEHGHLNTAAGTELLDLKQPTIYNKMALVQSALNWFCIFCYLALPYPHLYNLNTSISSYCKKQSLNPAKLVTGAS
jgi:hypothetical protein